MLPRRSKMPRVRKPLKKPLSLRRQRHLLLPSLQPIKSLKRPVRILRGPPQ